MPLNNHRRKTIRSKKRVNAKQQGHLYMIRGLVNAISFLEDESYDPKACIEILIFWMQHGLVPRTLANRCTHHFNHSAEQWTAFSVHGVLSSLPPSSADPLFLRLRFVQPGFSRKDSNNTISYYPANSVAQNFAEKYKRRFPFTIQSAVFKNVDFYVPDIYPR